MFKTQKPSFIFLDASAFFRFPAQNEEGRIYIMDFLPLSVNKIKLGMGQGNAKSIKENFFANKENFLTTIFPFYKYHSLWNKLTMNNLMVKSKNCYSTFGFNMFSSQEPYDVYWTNTDDIENNIINRYQTIKNFYIDNNVSIEVPKNIWFTSQLPEESIRYVSLIKDLCLANNCRLILFKNPSIKLPNFYRGSWTRTKSEKVKVLASSLGVEFIDFQYDNDIGIDWNKDTADSGAHLNYLGAQKISHFFADYLKDKCIPKKNEEIEKNLEKYSQHTSLAMLHLENDFSKYIDLVGNFSDELCIFMALSDTGLFEATPEQKNVLDNLGLNYHRNSEWADSYIAIIDNGVVKLDSRSNREQKVSYKLENNEKFIIESRGFLAAPLASIKLNDKEYSMNKRGLNIVINDKNAHMVIDSCVFDFFDVTNSTAKRKYSNNYLFKYEAYLIQGN